MTDLIFAAIFVIVHLLFWKWVHKWGKESGVFFDE
jgi:hypothetical protein